MTQRKAGHFERSETWPQQRPPGWWRPLVHTPSWWMLQGETGSSPTSYTTCHYTIRHTSLRWIRSNMAAHQHQHSLVLVFQISWFDSPYLTVCRDEFELPILPTRWVISHQTSPLVRLNLSNYRNYRLFFRWGCTKYKLNHWTVKTIKYTLQIQHSEKPEIPEHSCLTSLLYHVIDTYWYMTYEWFVLDSSACFPFLLIT